MISITTLEKDIIRREFPNVYIIRTMKGDSKRHHYYMTEEYAPMRLLRKIRGESETKNRHGKRKSKRFRKGE